MPLLPEKKVELGQQQGAARKRADYAFHLAPDFKQPRFFVEAFLEELDEHRLALAKSFKKSDDALDSGTLTEITQRTIDRLVFIRFLEDRLIEPNDIISQLGARGSAWGDFRAQCRRLDGIYNGIVFKKHPLLDSPDFSPDDDVFADI